MALEAKAVRAQKWQFKIAVAAGAIATTLMLANFDFGFRATADQMEYTQFAMTQAPADWFRYGKDVARYQGRIGAHFIMPLQIYGGLIGDMWFYPFLCIGTLAAIVGGFAIWMQILTRSPIALGFVIIYMALLPVGLNHWLPNAYPMQFLPLAIGLLCKVVFMRFFNSSWLNLPLKITLAITLFVATLSFETALTLFAILAAAEVIVYLQNSDEEGRLSLSYVKWQVTIFALAASAFLSYRFLYPSTYEGNQLPIDPVSNQILTTALHLYYATSIDTLKQANWLNILDGRRIVEAVLVGFGAGIAIYLSPQTSRHRGLLATIGVVTALATTIPISANHKFVNWCFFGDATCSYLDARFSLLGIVSIAVSFCAARAALFRSALAAVTGCASALVFLANASAGQKLQWISSGERLAKAYVCNDATTVAKVDVVQQLLALPIVFHGNRTSADKADYWKSYIDHLQDSHFWVCP